MQNIVLKPTKGRRQIGGMPLMHALMPVLIYAPLLSGTGLV
jgi:hypothetical protein